MKERRYSRKPRIFELDSIWVETRKHKCRSSTKFVPTKIGEIGWVKIPGQPRFAVFWNGTHLQEVMPRIAGEFSFASVTLADSGRGSVTPVAPSWEATNVPE